MLSANWISNVLTDTYGESYLRGGSLQTRFVRPIFEDDRIEIVIRVTARQDAHLLADVACVKENGEVATTGTATVVLP
jgi:acyl-CoA thioesterase FadM